MRTKTTLSDQRVIGYIRASTDDQQISPKTQQDALMKWCQSNGKVLSAICSDLGISGGSPLDKRPGLIEAMELLKKNQAGILLVAKRDRLARDVVIAAMIERLTERIGARILTVDGTGNGNGPEAELMRGIIDIFAQYERALIRSRTKMSLATKKANNERTGGIPYGYHMAQDNVHLEKDLDEQKVIQKILALKNKGLSIRKIVAQLNRETTPARGKRWHATTIFNILHH